MTKPFEAEFSPNTGKIFNPVPKNIEDFRNYAEDRNLCWHMLEPEPDDPMFTTFAVCESDDYYSYCNYFYYNNGCLYGDLTIFETFDEDGYLNRTTTWRTDYSESSSYAECNYSKEYSSPISDTSNDDGVIGHVTCTHSADGVRHFRLYDSPAGEDGNFIESAKFDKWHKMISHKKSSNTHIKSLELEITRTDILTPREQIFKELKNRWNEDFGYYKNGFISVPELRKEIYDLNEKFANTRCIKNLIRASDHAALLYPSEYTLKDFDELAVMPPSIIECLRREVAIAKKIGNEPMLDEIEVTLKKLFDYRDRPDYGRDSFVYIRYAVTDSGFRFQTFDLRTKKAAHIL